jgi:hypothetical protein
MSQNRTFPNPKSHAGRSPMGTQRCPMGASGQTDSPRLHTIMARLAMRAAQTKEVIGNPQI